MSLFHPHAFQSEQLATSASPRPLMPMEVILAQRAVEHMVATTPGPYRTAYEELLPEVRRTMVAVQDATTNPQFVAWSEASNFSNIAILAPTVVLERDQDGNEAVLAEAIDIGNAEIPQEHTDDAAREEDHFHEQADSVLAAPVEEDDAVAYDPFEDDGKDDELQDQEIAAILGGAIEEVRARKTAEREEAERLQAEKAAREKAAVKKREFDNRVDTIGRLKKKIEDAEPERIIEDPEQLARLGHVLRVYAKETRVEYEKDALRLIFEERPELEAGSAAWPTPVGETLARRVFKALQYRDPSKQLKHHTKLHS